MASLSQIVHFQLQHNSTDHKNTILFMFELCSMKATQSSVLTQEHKQAGTLDAEKIQEHFQDESWTGFKSASNIHTRRIKKNLQKLAILFGTKSNAYLQINRPIFGYSWLFLPIFAYFCLFANL